MVPTFIAMVPIQNRLNINLLPMDGGAQCVNFTHKKAALHSSTVRKRSAAK